jgi:hypothetical protein
MICPECHGSGWIAGEAGNTGGLPRRPAARAISPRQADEDLQRDLAKAEWRTPAETAALLRELVAQLGLATPSNAARETHVFRFRITITGAA